MLAEGLEWPIIRRGSGSPPIVLLHGFLGGKEDWLPVIDVIESSGVCFAPDLPGHGENILSDDVPEFPDVMNALEQLRITLAAPKWHLVGYSLGGRLALAYSLVFPEHVTSLTMVSSSPGIEFVEQREQRREQDERWAARFESEPPEQVVRAWYDQKVFESLQSSTELRQHIVQRRCAGAMPLLADCLRKWGQGIMPSAWGRLTRLNVPSFWVSGSLDPTYVNLGRQVQERQPAARLATISGAGHTVHLEKPADLGHSIMQFLSATAQHATG